MADTTHKTKIVVEGESSKAVSAFAAVRSAIQGVSRVISVFTRSLAIFGLAVNAIQLVVEGYKRLTSWIEKTAGASKELFDRRESDRHASAIDAITDRYKLLNDEIKKTADLEASIKGIVDDRKSRSRDLEDARLERDKQLEIAKLNPASPSYEKDKKAIESKYAGKADDIAVERASKDAYERQKELNDKANAKDTEVAKLEKLLTSARGALSIAQSGGDDKRIEEAKKKVDEIMEAIAKGKEDAVLLRERASDAINSNDASLVRRDANAAKRRADEKASAQKEADDYTANMQKELQRSSRQRREEETARIDEKKKRISAIESYDASLKDAAAPSQNRLTAMGLGAGVSAPTVGLSGDVHKMLDIMKQQLEESKKQNNARSEIASLFSD